MKRKLFRSLQVILMALVLMLVTVGQPAIANAATTVNILKNSSFEQGTGNGLGSTIYDWSVSGGRDTVIRTNWRTIGYNVYPHGGSFVAEFNRAGRPAQGVLSQSFKTVPGTKYTLSFYAYENGYNSPASSKALVQVNGQGKPGFLVNQTVEATSQNWQKSTFSFVANSTTTTVKFSDRSTGDLASTDFVLDDITVLGPSNYPPTVAVPISDQVATEDSPFNYVVPANTFQDPDGNALRFSATLADGSPLPAWLSFDPATRTFSGTPKQPDVGAVTLKVSANDGKGGAVSSNFKLTVNDIPNNYTINIDSTKNLSPETGAKITLPAGTYTLHVIGQADGGNYDAWNRNIRIEGCDENGEHCTKGWEHKYFYQVGESNSVKVDRTDRYATAEAALANPPADVSFTLTEETEVDFYVKDNCADPINDNCGDPTNNQGGVSLQVISQS